METFWTLTVILLALSSGTVICKRKGGECLTWSACSASCGKGIKTGTLKITQECNEKPCQPTCKAGLDIGIILDKSASVGTANLRVVLGFVKALIKAFNPAPNGDHFGLITFNQDATMVFNFSDSKYQNEDDLLKKIDEEPIVLGANTHTDRALEMARDGLFTAAGGDRPDKANLLIVLTDGEPYWGRTSDGKPIPSPADFQKFAMEISEDFEEKAVFRVAVGFGPKAQQLTNTLQLIAGDGNPVHQIVDVNSMKDAVDKIKASACSGAASA